MDFTQFLTRTYSANNNNDHLYTEFVHTTETKFNTDILCLDNHYQSFWKLIDCTVQCVLA